MGKVDFFTIFLEKQTPIYFSGEMLKGFLKLKVSDRFKINSINMKITGGAVVRWSEQHGSGKHRRTVVYSAYETYINLDLVFLARNGNSDLYLEAGEYNYPFELVLPPNLPTSFEHQIGKVRYSLQATIDIPWAFDKHSIRSFSVLSHYDLNMNPSLRQPFGGSGQKVLCCGPCKSDPITATIETIKGGFVPGEGIQFIATIDNKSSRSIDDFTINLMQIIKFHATRKTRTCFRNVSSVKYPQKVREKSLEKWNGVLVIPAVCSSSNGTCRIIDVSYLLVLNFDASGIAVSTDICVPIAIGTIPLAQLNAPVQPQIPYSLQEDVFEPTPDDTVIGNGKGEVVESNNNSYKPIYPYYKDFGIV